VALLLWGLVALSYGRLRWAALAAGLAAVCRPEGGILLLIWGLRWFQSRRKDALAAALAAAMPVVWLAFSFPYYGTPVPHSLVAKSAPLYAISSTEATAAVLGRLVRWTGLAAAGPVAPTAGILLTLGITIAAALSAARPGAPGGGDARRLVLVLLAWTLVYTRPGVRLFGWYLPMLWVPWMCLVIVGACATLPAGSRATRVLIAALASLAVSLYPLGMLMGLAQGAGPLPYETAYRQRVVAYRGAAEWLAARAPADATVMACEIGALGYYSGAHMFDAGALVTPSALSYLPIPAEERTSPLTGAIRLVALHEVQPDYIVVTPAHLTDRTRRDFWFVAHYAETYSAAVANATEAVERVIVYTRVSGA